MAARDDLLDRMTRSRLPWTSSRLREWYDEARLAAQLTDYLSTDAGRVGDVTFGAEFRDAVEPAHGLLQRLPARDVDVL